MHAKEKKRKILYKRQNGLCWLCSLGMPMDEVTFDHVIPKSRGGGNELHNLKLAHKICNSRRKNSMDEVFIRFGATVVLKHKAAAKKLWPEEI